jgi:hypothetical protein
MIVRAVILVFCSFLFGEAPAAVAKPAGNTAVHAPKKKVVRKKLVAKKHTTPLRRVRPSVDKNYAPTQNAGKRMADAVNAYKVCMYGDLSPDEDRIERAVSLNLAYREDRTLGGNAEKLGREVCLAEALGLNRYETQAEIDAAKGSDLFPISGKFVLIPDDQVPIERRYARAWVKEYVEALAYDLHVYLLRRHGDSGEVAQLRINSLVRSLSGQAAQASPAKCRNEICSTHLTGSTVDVSNHSAKVDREVRDWVRDRLIADRKDGKIVMIQEFHSAHYHVFVIPPEFRPKEEIVQ